jgi:peptidoglycan/LPS O-acetylase OafA/YrhL
MRARLFALTERAKRRLGAHDHMPALDGVRGVAILLVVLRHFFMGMQNEFGWDDPLLRVFRLGWVGVDLFFVLSGFLITSILDDSKQKGSAGYFKNFYARRALRIFPVYYLALLAMLALRVLWPGVDAGEAHPGWQWVYLTNVVQAAENTHAFGITGHFWSLAVEEHYYLVWPAMVLVLSRRGLMIIAALAAIVALLLRVTQVADGQLQMAAYVLTPMRMDSLAAGSFLALLLRSERPLMAYFKPALATALIAGLGFTAILFWRNNFDYRDALIGTFGMSFLWALFAATIVLALTWRPLELAFTAPALRWFGKISYGLYVWHAIVFGLVFYTDIARSLRPFDGAAQALSIAAVALGLALAVTLASWHLWEKPFLRMKAIFAGEPRPMTGRASAWDNVSSKR